MPASREDLPWWSGLWAWIIYDVISGYPDPQLEHWDDDPLLMALYHKPDDAEKTLFDAPLVFIVFFVVARVLRRMSRAGVA